MANYKDTLKFVGEVVKTIKDKDTVEYFNKLINGINSASELEVDPADEERRAAQLEFNSISLANQVVFTAFAEGKLADDVEAEYRKLPSLKEAKEALSKATEAAMEEEKDLTDKLNAFRERGRKYDLVHAVCAGRSVEEAKNLQKEYDKQMAQQPMRG